MKIYNSSTIDYCSRRLYIICAAYYVMGNLQRIGSTWKCRENSFASHGECISCNYQCQLYSILYLIMYATVGSILYNSITSLLCMIMFMTRQSRIIAERRQILYVTMSNKKYLYCFFDVNGSIKRRANNEND